MTQASIFDQAVKMEKLLCDAFSAQNYEPFREDGVTYINLNTQEDSIVFRDLLNISQMAEDIVRVQS